MAVLFAATEAESYELPEPGNVSVTTSTDRFDQTYSRCAIRADETGTLIAHFVSSVSNEVWFHCKAYLTNNDSTFHSDPWIKFYDSGNSQVLFQIDADREGGDTINNLEIWNGASFDEVGSGFIVPEFQLFDMDIQIIIDDTNGAFRYYQDGVLVSEFTGDTSTVTSPALDQLILGTLANQSGNSYAPYYSEVIVATEQTIGWHLGTLAPDGDGAQTDWAGDYTNIDEIGTVDYADFVFSQAADETSTFTLSNITVPTNHEVKAVTVGAAARAGTTGPQNMELVARTNSTDYTSGEVTGIGTSWNGFNHVWDVNPNTSIQWTESEVNSLEAGVKSKT